MNKKTLALTLGSAMATALAASPMVHAQENPFGLQKISGAGLMVAAADEKKADGTCGANKVKEGKCSANKVVEGKCGEGKCGADKMKEGACSGAAKPTDGATKPKVN
jgi:uncharacterized low-complexity protein